MSSKIKSGTDLLRSDYDRINELLSKYKNCAELYLLRSDALLSRHQDVDFNQAKRDLASTLAFEPSIRSFDVNIEAGDYDLLSTSSQFRGPRKTIVSSHSDTRMSIAKPMSGYERLYEV